MKETYIDAKMAAMIADFIYCVVADIDDEGSGLPYDMKQEQYEAIKSELKSEMEDIAHRTKNKVLAISLRLQGRPITINTIERGQR